MKAKTGWFFGVLTIVFVVGYACQDLPVDSSLSVQEKAVTAEATVETDAQTIKSKGHGHIQRNFRTHLNGGNEVPAVETNAQGQAIFQVDRDGSSIHYRLIASNIENVRMAHIHLAPPGENGGIVVWLYPSAPPPQLIEGRSQGVLAEGTITADNLVGSLEDQTLDDLIEEIKSGNAYVNVHTSQNPGGEIRGQIF